MKSSLIRGGSPIELRLRKSLVRDIKRGHAWLFSSAIETPPAPAGTSAVVIDRDGTKIASGIYDSTHAIPLRICKTCPPWQLDDAWLIETLERSIAWRIRLFDHTTTGYRLVNGEGDRLPGLVIDRYANTAVIKLDGGAPQAFYNSAAIAQWLSDRLALESVIERSRQRGTTGAAVLGPTPTSPVPFQENGMQFCADVLVGQKTGFFLDQRDNRALIRKLAAGLSVLNLFSFSGGFSIAAGLGGAEHVVSVDLAQPAIEQACRHWEINGLDAHQHLGVSEDVFEFLERSAAQKQTWDLVICDPPSFSPSEATKQRGLEAYGRLAQLAAKVARRGGWLALASCSSHISMQEFESCCLEALGRVRRSARLIAQRALPPDHTTPLAMPELRYLKFLLLRLDN